ncbi:MAG TPA: hypothetical protein VK971_09035 [Thiohalobacter sp.]|nr:hypothetical protein [Thiohalobacter sp.]
MGQHAKHIDHGHAVDNTVAGLTQRTLARRVRAGIAIGLNTPAAQQGTRNGIQLVRLDQQRRAECPRRQ